ncbi:MAG TPA: 3-hydroxyacyl-CoA dehydrogenase NAD-binding domain-containing protein [Candidatus Angelobacter sp.]|nr:3-hydroxyacyl-CoA dehydrogenase NAD-binding domain-containing protein [Candidatus Angelobacter sp.]
MPEIKTVAVIGAGPAGRRIAETAALAGLRTILVDILPSSLRQAESEMRDRLQQAQERGGLSAVAANAALARLELAPGVAEAAREADLVIEAVPDEMESKLEILTLLDKISRPQTILASTTRSLSVSEIASVTYRSSKVLGLRFGFSMDNAGEPRMEIVRGRQTDDEAVAMCAEAGRRMGLAVALVQESSAN